MTYKQIDAARKALYRVPWEKWTDEQKTLYEELSCRIMINSFLTYGGIRSFWYESPFRPPYDNSYSAKYVRSLGLKRVQDLVIEQEADYAKAKVIHGTYTDSEGVTYNSVIWGDEELEG